MHTNLQADLKDLPLLGNLEIAANGTRDLFARVGA